MFAINYITATELEAKALVEFYKATNLKSKPFAVYQACEPDVTINILVTGIGALNAHAAVAWFAGFNGAVSGCWINLGIAGHQSLPVGTAVLVSQINGPLLAQAFYPTVIAKWSGHFSSLTTLDAPSDLYNNTLFDMEASGVCAAAQRFTSREWIQVIKVVSDNQAKPHGEFKKSQVVELVRDELATINTYVRAVAQLAVNTKGDSALGVSIPSLPFKTSHSQNRIINEAVSKLHRVGSWDEEQLSRVLACSDAKAAIKALNSQLDALVPEF